jgi:hypothetical protein
VRRYHLFEIEDQPWFPAFLRDYMTDFLRSVSDWMHLFEPAVPILERGLRSTQGATIVDLASGGGGGWRKVAADLAPRVPGVRVVLTDLYPNEAALRRLVASMPEVFRMESQPVDARAVPPALSGLRTQFLSFHHFRPRDACRILQNAVDSGAPIAIFEIQRRSIADALKFALSPINVLLTTPFIRPFRWGRLFWTYVIPVVPLAVMWDGVVSVLRTYSPEEMRAMAAGLDGGESYVWEVGIANGGKAPMPYLLGYRAEGSSSVQP